LSVFAGGWDLVAAEEVCADSILPPADILDLLSQLINKSLVLVGSEQGNKTRYRLLETLRQYALSKVVDTEEWANLRNRHLAFFLHLVEEIEPKLNTAEQVERMNQLKAEHDNLRGALGWSLGDDLSSMAVEGLRMASALLQFWQFNGLPTEGYKWLKKGLAVIDRQDVRLIPLWAKVHYALGMINILFHHHDARQTVEESVALYRECGDKAGLARALCLMYYLVHDIPNLLEKVRPQIDEALELARESGDLSTLAQALVMKAEVAYHAADAILYAEESLKIFLELGDKWGATDPLEVLCSASIDQGNFSAAREYSGKLLELTQEGGHKRGLAQAYFTQGRIAYFLNEFSQMEEYFQKGLALSREFGSLGWIIWSLRQMGIAAKRQAEYQRAAAYLLENLILAEKMKDDHGIIMTLGLMAGIAAGAGQPRRAAILLGAEEVQLESSGWQLDRQEGVEFERDIASVRAQLDEATFQVAWSEGRRMTLKQAVAEVFAIGLELNPS
jgi:tetratricopeptide (TPR) repeat protein